MSGEAIRALTAIGYIAAQAVAWQTPEPIKGWIALASAVVLFGVCIVTLDRKRL